MPHKTKKYYNRLQIKFTKLKTQCVLAYMCVDEIYKRNK